MIRVLLAEDQHLVRGALAALLSLQPDLDVIAQVGHGDQVLPAVDRHRPDIVLLDIDMPGLDGLSAAARITATLTECRVIIVTALSRPGYLRRAMQAGAHGFVVKDAPAEHLSAAIRAVHRGQRVVDHHLAAAVLAATACPLTGRERDVLAAAADTATIADIAARLYLAPGTVRNYLSSAIAKTGAHTRAEAIHIAEEHGWL